MIQVDKMKYLRKYTGQIIIPTNKEDIHKSSCVILLNRNKGSIFSVLNDITIDDKNLFNFVYRSRDIEFFIKSDRIIEKGTTSRNEYYKACRDGLKLTGIISISSLKERNFYFDTYFEHEAFINNSAGLTEINRCNEYLRLLKVHLIGFSTLENYKTKIVLMQLDDWKNAEINPLDMLNTACLKSFESFKEIGDVDFVFFTNKTLFKINPSKISISDRTKFSIMCQDLKNAMGEIDDTLNSEIPMDDEDSEEPEEDEVAAEKIRQQEERLSEEESVEDEEEVKKIADKVMEPVIIKKDAISKRDAELRERQKTLKVDGVKIGDLTEIHDKQTDYAELPVNDVSGDVNTLNKNVTRVQFASFTHSYNEHFYHRDIMSIADALKDKSIPVFVRDAKREDTSDSLNQKYTYTFYLEDSNRGRHTLKFDMPKFVEGKYMYLNGHKKEFTNQRIAKPLIKTGPDTVQVVTNYNKIFMTRHGEKVEALYEKFKELVISDTKHFSFKRGDCSRLNAEYMTTIEYDTLAKQFAEIIVKPPEGPRLCLIFSQPKLKELCCEKLGLEKEWKNAQENNQMVAGYFEDTKSRQLYTIELKTSDIAQIIPAKEAVGNAFPADEYIGEEPPIQNSIQTIEWNINVIESYLDSVIEEYKLDPMEVFGAVEEGILSTVWKGIKELAKGVLSLIVKLWNGLTSLVKFFFRKIKSFFGSSSSSARSNNFVPQEVSFISLEAANVQQATISSPGELQEIVVEHIESISREIRERSKIQIEATKEMNRILESKEDAVQERAVTGGDLNLDPVDDEYQFTMPGRDIVASKQMITPRKFDAKSFKLLEQANDIVKAYNDWVNGDIERVLKTVPLDKASASVTDHDLSGNESFMVLCYNGAIAAGVSKEEVMKFIRAEFYKIPDNPEAIRHMINLRLNYNKRICSLLEQMLKINYAILGVTSEATNEIIQKLREGDPDAIGRVNDIITKNRSKFTKELITNGMKHNYLDFSAIGGGICYYTYEDLRNIKEIMLKTPERLFNMALRFDYVILGHGGTGKDYSRIDKLENENEEYRNLQYKRSDIEFDVSSGKPVKRDPSTFTDEERNELMKIRSRLSDIENLNGLSYWLIQPVATKHFPATNNVNQLLRNVIEEGHMVGKTRIKIMLVCCNGGHFVLEDDVRNTKGVTILHATNKMVLD